MSLKIRRLAGQIGIVILGLGLTFLTSGPVLADQIVVCQSCTSAPGGDPNLITDTTSFRMFLNGSSATSDSPTLIVIAEYNGIGGPPTVSVQGTGALSLATVGTWGLDANTVNNWNSGSPSTVFSALGLKAGGSLNFGNLNNGLTANGIAPATSFNLYAFQYNAGLTHDPIFLSTSAGLGSYIFGYGCSRDSFVTTGDCGRPDGGYISQTVMTNSGLNVPEPGSLILLGAGLVGIGIWRRRLA